MAYTIFLTLHNLVRWLTLIAGLFAVLRSWLGWQGKKTWEQQDRLAKTVFVITMDIQIVLGVILYAALSPITRAAFANMGEAMKNKELRFFAVEHIFIMVAATALVHIGAVKIKKADNDDSRFKFGAIFFTIAMVLILGGIPWSRRMLPF